MIINHKNLKNSFGTPEDIYLDCMNRNGFKKATLDVCADSNNSKCKFYISEKINSLRVDWLFQNSSLKNNERRTINFHKLFNTKPIVFCNPPHNKTKLFVMKAFNEWKKLDIDIVMLIPINCLSNNYAREYILPYVQIRNYMILPRINFLDPKTNKPSKYNSVNGYVTFAYYRTREK